MTTILTQSEAVETLTVASTRFEQSGKKTLATSLAALAEQIRGSGFPVDASGPQPARAQVSRPETAAQPDAEIIPDALDNVADYVAENGEVDLIQTAIKSGINVLLTGPTQCGKTTLAQWTAKQLGREIFTIQGGAGATFERIIAKDTLIESQGATITRRQLGVLPVAMQRGAILYVDEPNAIPSEALFYLFSAMDYRKTITFDDGSTMKAAEGFTVVQAMNEGQGYAGTALLNSAFRARSVVIDMTYLPPDREAKLIADRTGIDKDTAQKLADVAATLRASHACKTLRTPIGVSATLFCARLIAAGLSVAKAAQVAITNQVPAQFASERNSITDVLAAYFGKGQV